MSVKAARPQFGGVADELLLLLRDLGVERGELPQVFNRRRSQYCSVNSVWRRSESPIACFGLLKRLYEIA